MRTLEVKARRKLELDGCIIEKGEIITVTPCKKDFVLWHGTGLYELEIDDIGETIRVISEQ